MIQVGHGPEINYKSCNGCRTCYDDCPSDVFTWDEEKGLPSVAYPDECYYCAACDVGCPEEAISLTMPLHAMLYLGGLYPET